MLGGRANSGVRLRVVGRTENRHPRQHPHEGEILRPLMRASVVRRGKPRVCSDDLHVRAVVADGLANLIERARDEDRVRSRERHQPAQR